jgi:hypothetical protein
MSCYFARAGIQTDSASVFLYTTGEFTAIIYIQGICIFENGLICNAEI